MTPPDAGRDFQIDLPDGWEDQTIFTFRGPDDSGVQHNLVLIIDNQLRTKDLASYVKPRIETIKETLTGLEIMGEREITLGSGDKAYEIVYKWMPTANKKLVQKQVFTIIGDKAYNFTASFSKQSIKTIGRQVDEMINSFKPAADGQQS